MDTIAEIKKKKRKRGGAVEGHHAKRRLDRPQRRRRADGGETDNFDQYDSGQPESNTPPRLTDSDLGPNKPEIYTDQKYKDQAISAAQKRVDDDTQAESAAASPWKHGILRKDYAQGIADAAHQTALDKARLETANKSVVRKFSQD